MFAPASSTRVISSGSLTVIQSGSSFIWEVEHPPSFTICRAACRLFRSRAVMRVGHS